MRQPTKHFDLIEMVTCSVGVQTSCPSSPTYIHSNILAKVENTRPSHFTEIHITKLEDAFSRQQKPDEIRLQILAMECNLLYKDVKDWFKARRLKWIEDLVKDELIEHDTNNNTSCKKITKALVTASHSSSTNSTNHSPLQTKSYTSKTLQNDTLENNCVTNSHSSPEDDIERNQKEIASGGES